MRAIVIHGAKDLRIEDCPVEPPAAGEVQIKMATGGVCGSDLHYYNHGGFGTVRLKQPMILGHEVSGHIVTLGDGVGGEGRDELSIGDLVAVSPSRPCVTCTFCKEGLPNHCENMRFYGSAMPFPHIHGAFSEVLNVSVSQCVNADGLSAGEAAMAEPLSVALHATRRAGDLSGKRVLVTGCGPIGCLSIMAARNAGVSEIIATDLSANALTFAKSVGADRTINMIEEPDALSDYCEGKGTFEVFYECSGAQPALAAGLAAMRPRGVVVQLGLGGDMTLPMMMITAKELDLRGSFRFHEEFPNAVALMQSGAIDVKPLISHTIAFEGAEQAFLVANDRNLAMKAQIKFD